MAGFNDYYYFGIDDNKRTFQLTDILLFGQLEGYHSRGWYACDIDGERSVKRFSFSSTAASGGGRYGDRGEYYVEIEYHIRTIEQSHVIAVYENGTYSERWGRYYTAEKMAVIQVDITSAPEPGSPFVQGINTIVIPSSVFLNSKLNSLVQVVGDANQTEWDNDVPPCLKSETGETQFQGIDRSNMDSKMSEQIEILISKKDCSPHVAMQLLNLTLTGMVNETTGEEGIIYNFDANATHIAALMNLPYDVFKIVPIFSEYQHSATGNKPHML